MNEKKTILNVRKSGAERMLEQARNNIDMLAAQKQAFQAIARGLDEALNGEDRGDMRQIGFTLIVYPFHGIDQGATFVSNGDGDFIPLLEMQLNILKQEQAKKEHK